MIRVQDLSFAYPGRQPVLNRVSFSAEKGDMLLVGGASGCGKTTLLHCLCGIIPRHVDGRLSGVVEIDGRAPGGLSPAEWPHTVAIVFQQPETHMFLPAVRDEMAFAPENLCLPRDEMKRRIDLALDETGLGSLAGCAPEKLSGGQQKLAALACLLALPPRVLLLDEMTAGLDAGAVSVLQRVLARLLGQGTTVVLSDHHTERWPQARRLNLEKQP